MIAINLVDLATFRRDNPIISSILFNPSLFGDVIEIGNRFDDFALPFLDGDVGMNAALILIEKYLRLRPVRIYERSGSGWRYFRSE